MGRRVTQRILKCDICGDTPDNGEHLYEMPGGYWCERCETHHLPEDEDDDLTDKGKGL